MNLCAELLNVTAKGALASELHPSLAHSLSHSSYDSVVTGL